MNQKKRAPLGGAVIAALTVSGTLLLAGLGPARGSEERFHDVREQTAEFMRYHREIELEPEQEMIFRRALAALPAPCCSNNTALTCCCPCNMAQSWWGLAKHLIANEGRGEDEVKQIVAEWFEFINPDGFSGDVCYTGGCNRPFAENGCGGMDPANVRF